MAKITNNHSTALGLPDGTVIAAGESVTVAGWDKIKDNAVVKAWLDRKVLSASGKAAEKDEEKAGEDEKAQLQAQLDELGVKYHPRAGVEKLREALVEAGKS